MKLCSAVCMRCPHAEISDQTATVRTYDEDFPESVLDRAGYDFDRAVVESDRWWCEAVLFYMDLGSEFYTPQHMCIPMVDGEIQYEPVPEHLIKEDCPFFLEHVLAAEAEEKKTQNILGDLLKKALGS